MCAFTFVPFIMMFPQCAQIITFIHFRVYVSVKNVMLKNLSHHIAEMNIIDI